MFCERVPTPRLFAEGCRPNNKLGEIDGELAIGGANVEVLAVGFERGKEPHNTIKYEFSSSLE